MKTRKSRSWRACQMTSKNRRMKWKLKIGKLSKILQIQYVLFYQPCYPSKIGAFHLYAELSQLAGMIFNLFSFGEIFSQTHKQACFSIQTSITFCGAKTKIKNNLLILLCQLGCIQFIWKIFSSRQPNLIEDYLYNHYHYHYMNHSYTKPLQRF